MSLKIGITYNLKKDFAPSENQPIDALEEFDSEETIDAIRRVLEDDGHEVTKLGGDRGLIDRLRKTPVDIVFNIAEGHGGRNREAHIPALLEFLGIPYTGSDPLTLSLTLDKSAAKRVLVSEGIPTPRFKKVERLEDLEGLTLRYPLFVKLCYEGSSKGVRLDSKVWDLPSLKEKTGWLLETYRSPVLVEEFIQGPEFTVGILGNETPSVLGVMQIEIKGVSPSEAIYSLEVKREWEEKVQYLCPPPIDAFSFDKNRKGGPSILQGPGMPGCFKSRYPGGRGWRSLLLGGESPSGPFPCSTETSRSWPGGWNGVMTNWSRPFFTMP